MSYVVSADITNSDKVAKTAPYYFLHPERNEQKWPTDTITSALIKVWNERGWIYSRLSLWQFFKLCHGNDTTFTISSMSSSVCRTFQNSTRKIMSFVKLFLLYQVFWDIFWHLLSHPSQLYSRFILWLLKKVLVKYLCIIWYSKFKVLEKAKKRLY